MPVTVEVSVREANGTPLDVGAIVRLHSRVGSYDRTATTRDGATASFPDVLPGEYEIEVQAGGYQTTTEQASVMGGGLQSTFYIYLRPGSAAAGGSRPPGAPIFTPKLQRDLDKILRNIQKQRYAEALKQLGKVEKRSPGSPDVHYLVGVTQAALGNQDAAREEFEAALRIYPGHVRSLLALGELQLRTGQSNLAVKTLEKAYQLDGADWRTEYLLACAYFYTKEYEKADRHAQRAVKLHKGNLPQAGLLLTKISAARVASEASKNSLRQKEKNSITVAETAPPEKPGSGGPPSAPPATLVAPDPLAKPMPRLPSTPAEARAWAPPDIDSKDYPFVSDVSCPEQRVLLHAQLKMKKQLENFERFTATEHIIHVQLDKNGIPGIPREKDFAYLVTLERPGDGMTYLDESRDGHENLSQFPTSLAIKGLVFIGVAVLDQHLQKDLNFRCDGLTQWHGEPAWELRFEEKNNVPSRLMAWKNSQGSFDMPLRGRVWVSANSYSLLHLESDLREPVPALELTRDHLVIDYGPVHFSHGNTDLWLPMQADAYMELHGKRYHHTHTLTNYMLFSVDITNKVAAPKEQPDPQ